VPDGAAVIAQTRGTAPGLICPVGDQVIYAVPGVPHEMREMMGRAVLPDLQRRAGTHAVILSRVLRTWGMAESTLAEVVAPRFAALDTGGANPTIAFLASGIEGIKVRITAKAATEAEARHLLEVEEAELRAVLGEAVFGTDDETMEHAVGRLLAHRGLWLALAESVTGGLIASRIVAVPGASQWFRGSVVAYDPAVKRNLLGVPEGPVVSSEAARAMAEGARRALCADVGLGVTGVAGPDSSEGHAPGTVFYSQVGPGELVSTGRLQVPGDRDRVREFAALSVLGNLFRSLLAAEGT
jgi:nicotinamide-nucleotide amidase